MVCFMDSIFYDEYRNRTGRPLKDIDAGTLIEYRLLGFSNPQIAKMLRVSLPTIERRVKYLTDKGYIPKRSLYYGPHFKLKGEL